MMGRSSFTPRDRNTVRLADKTCAIQITHRVVEVAHNAKYNIKELDKFLDVKMVGGLLAEKSLGRLCVDNGVLFFF